jgi:hypothetical protein
LVAGKTQAATKAATGDTPIGPTGRPYQGFPTPPKLDGHGPARIIVSRMSVWLGDSLVMMGFFVALRQASTTFADMSG